MLRRLLPLALALLALPALAQEAAEAPAAPAALPSITVSTVAPRPLTDRVIASGLVAAVETVQVQPLIEGQPIDALLADVGDRVEAGQVLARLSTSTLELQLSQLQANKAAAESAVAQAEASLAQAQANADEAERQAARNAELAEAGTVPRAQADQTRAAAEAARAAVTVAEQGIGSARAQGELVAAQIANAELQLSRAEVKAPVAGLVTARNAQVGAVASAAGQPMFTIIKDGALELNAEVSEQDLLRLEAGQRAVLRVSADGPAIAGKVRLVEPTIDPQTRLGIAHIWVDPASNVVSGMFLTAEVIVAEETALAVPVTALGSDDEGATVMRVEGGVVERRRVTPGIRDAGFVGIAEGLSEGDEVVTKAAAFVRDGDRINPVPEGQAAAQPPAATAPAAAPGTPDAAPAAPAEE